MGSAASTEMTIKETIPSWVYTVKIPPEYTGDKLGACSDGMSHVGPNTITRSRAGQLDTDGARWSRGFTSGKHTFEIVFPMAHRGYQATVGVATEDAPLFAKGKVPLVGANKSSWGICLRGRKAFHKNGIVRQYPVTQVFLPDKFYMYLDADGGTLQFGSDLDYYGTALSGISRNQPLYPTVSATIQRATITMVYRGMGDAFAIGPPPPCVVPAAPQMMSPAVVARQEPPPPPPPTVVSNTLPSSAPEQESITGQKIEERLEEIQEQSASGGPGAEKDAGDDAKPGEEKPQQQQPPPPPAEAEAKKAEPEAKAEAEPEAKTAEAEPEAKKASEPEAKKAAEPEAKAEKAAPTEAEGSAEGKATSEPTEAAA